MEGSHILLLIVMLLTMTIVLVSISRRFHIPPLINYIFVGIIVGPFGLAIIENEESIHFLAEFGIVFLLFAIGLEFSLSQMMAMRKIVFGLGSIQVFTTAALFFAISYYVFGYDFSVSLVIATAFALSSTAIVIKQLTEQSEIQTRHGRSAVGILIFQDIMAIPLLILIPALGVAAAGSSSLPSELGFALLKGLIVVAVMLLVGRYLLRPLFKEVASAKSEELFMLAVLTVVLGSAVFTEELGISMTLGAFMAGMMLGETEYRHQIEADIRPFQNILLGLFFITVGMLISVPLLFENFFTILAITLAVIVLKFLVIHIAMRLLKKPAGVSVRTATSLAQAGEFGLVLITLAITYKVVSQDLAQLLLSAGVLSMLVTPFMLKHNGKIAKLLCSKSYQKNFDDLSNVIQEDSKFLSDHVVLLGFGRVGQTTAKFMEQANTPFVALDMDIARVEEAQRSGEPVYFGDSANPAILRATNLEAAKIALISFNDFHASLKTLKTLKRLAPNLPVLVRTLDDAHLNELLDAGATEVIPDTFESSIMLSSHLLLMLGKPAHKVIKQTRDARKNRYAIFDGIYAGEGDETKDHQVMKGIIHSVQIDESAYQVGKQLKEIPFTEFNVIVKAIKRGSVKGDNPDEGTRVRVNDVLVLQGAPENIELAEKWIKSGSPL